MAAAALAPLPRLFPFVFFGCWNRPGEKGSTKTLPRDIVADEIRKIKDDIQTIVIGGDNVYPRPGDKTKAHDPAVFDEGLRLYTRLGKPIVIAFGNHNVGTYEELQPNARTFEVKSMLNYQKTHTGFASDDKTYYIKSYAEGVDIVVLDTNMMDNADMLTWFDETVRTIIGAGRRYFVVQHEPYFTASEKEKKGKKEPKFGSLNRGSDFLKVMFQRGVPIAVLCADTHHYQHGIIERIGITGPPIHQIIVGTGGADPDAHLTGFVSQDFEGGYTLTKILEDTGFGFLYVKSPDSDAARFVNVAPWTVAGGRRRSTRRPRRHAGVRQRTRRNSK